MNRLAVGNVIASMDRCDPTRSHEVIPSMRLHYAYRHRRFTRRMYGSLALIAACAGLIAGLAQ